MISQGFVCARQPPKEPLSEAEGRVWRSGANKPRERIQGNQCVSEQARHTLFPSVIMFYTLRPRACTSAVSDTGNVVIISSINSSSEEIFRSSTRIIIPVIPLV